MGSYQVNNPSGVIQPLRYPGQYQDQETGLFYNMNRYYAPSLGRYLSPAQFTYGPDDKRLLLPYDWQAFTKKEYKRFPLRRGVSNDYLPKELIKILVIQFGQNHPETKNIYEYALRSEERRV